MDDRYTYKSNFSNKKLAILNTVLIFSYLIYLASSIWFCADFFINTYNTDFKTAETIGFFLFICSLVSVVPVFISLCLIIIKTIKRQWLVYTPPVVTNPSAYPGRKIDRYALGIIGGIFAAIFLIAIFIIFFYRLSLTGYLSISITFLSVVIADVIGIILSKSYNLI